MDILKDFQLKEKVSVETIKKYKKKLPSDVIDFWREYGLGTFLGGYLKSVNPDDFEDVLKGSVIDDFRGAVVLFTTGLADLIIWDRNQIRICNYRYSRIDTLIQDLSLFFKYLEEEFFHSKALFTYPYQEAIQKYGELEYDEAFGYVPMLVLGGTESVNNLDKVKIKEHIMIFSALAAPIYHGDPLQRGKPNT